jgi:RNA polymerase sigma-70 factor (ECF subfamily)
LIDALTAEAEEQASRFDDMRAALRQCLTKLPANSRDLIERRYSREQALAAICQETRRNLSAVKVALMRVRLALRECIERKMGKANAS